MRLEDVLKTEGIEIGCDPVTLAWYHDSGWVLHGWEHMQVKDWDGLGVDWYSREEAVDRKPVFKSLQDAVIFMCNNSYMFDNVRGD